MMKSNIVISFLSATVRTGDENWEPIFICIRDLTDADPLLILRADPV